MALDIFNLMSQTKNYELTFYEEPSASLRSIIAINNSVLGPVLATTKIFNFKDVEKATKTALRLAYYNTYRAALLRREFGGGSVVLCGDPKKVKNEFYLRALGIYIEKLAGKIFVSHSSGLTYEDLRYIERETEYILGLDEELIKAGYSPSASMAKGIIWGIKAAIKEKMNKDDLSGLTFAVHGVDAVGYNFVMELLKVKDAQIIITDKVYDRIKSIQDQVPEVIVVKPSEIYKQSCDVFVSFTFDSTLGQKEIEQLDTQILSGSVNALVETEEHEKMLEEKGILYIPGYIINGGEIIMYDNELEGRGAEAVESQLQEIYTITLDLLRKARENKTSVNKVALETAENYIQNIAAIKQLR